MKKKIELEDTIKSAVVKFQEKTGLEISWIDIKTNKSVWFSTEKKDVIIDAKLRVS